MKGGRAVNREDFPLIAQETWAYLDNAATTQKPRRVLEKLEQVYHTCNANVHRSPHGLGREMTRQMERARDITARFFGAGEEYQVVFTSGTTGGINLTAGSYLETFGNRGDRVIVMESEHHSNFVPWQQLCKRKGLDFQVVPVTEKGQPDLDRFREALTSRTVMVALAHVTNTFGVENPVEEVVRLSHGKGVPVLVDGAQGAAHQPVDVSALDCDFYCVSAHKLYGPTGVGALIAKGCWLEKMVPWQFGGEMVDRVTREDTRFQPPPYRFEAGTPNFVGAVGFGEALEYLEDLGGMKAVAREEEQLWDYLWEELSRVPGVELPLGVKPQAGIVSFLLPPFHPYDVAVLLDQQGVAVRSGTHCAQPLLDSMGLSQGTVRVSLGLYNDARDVDRLCAGLRRIAAIKL